jgi:hypothetical protein
MNVADNGNEALALLQETGVAYPSGVDPVGEIQDAFRTITMPTTVFIDADGNIVDLHQGIISAEQLEAAIAELR